MSYAAALCSFARYEPWTKKDIIPAGRGQNGYVKLYGDISWKGDRMLVNVSSDIRCRSSRQL